MAKSSDEKMLQKGVYTGIIEQEEKKNFFCGAYKMVIANYKLGDLITIKSVIENPSDINYNQYPKKSKNFDKANHKPQQ